ncbi:MAG TPA: hypothetical protein VJ624_08220 [Thermodesulfobacteriota bacterium]|nr:hypothetical protein [Thermodesulfobacteriota bacterium]
MKKIVLIILVMMVAVFLGMKLGFAGMMCQEGMMGHGEMGSHSDHQQSVAEHAQPVTYDQSKAFMEDHLKSGNNPDLILGEVSETQDYFNAQVTTKDGTVVDKLQVDKATGVISSASETISNVQESENPVAAPQGHVH